MSASTPSYIVATGEVAGSASAAALPAITGVYWAKLKAAYDNAGYVYIGQSSVTKKDGTTDTTTGFPLAAGEESPWLRLANEKLSSLYYICDNTGDDLLYFVTL